MAKDRTQREWTDYAVKALESEAKQAGLLNEDTELKFSPGSPMNGISPEVVAYRGSGNRYEIQPSWLKTFTLKDTAKTVERLIDAQTKVIWAVNQIGK